MSEGVKIGILFACGTALFWGLYGPTLGKSRVMGPGETPFKVYVFIGLAYLVWGIIGGLIANKLNGGNFVFQPKMSTWGFAAGTLGAFGALCLTFAMFNAKRADLVMPVVFGGATSIAVLTEILSQRPIKAPAWQQMVGFVCVVVGVILVQAFAHHGHGPAKPPSGGDSSPPAAESAEH